MDASVLSAQNLVKSYGRLKAVGGLSIDIAAGSCVGLLGPNGAGLLDLGLEISVQLAFSVIFLLLGSQTFRRE